MLEGGDRSRSDMSEVFGLMIRMKLCARTWMMCCFFVKLQSQKIPPLLQMHRALIFALRSLSMLPRFMPCSGGEMAMSLSARFSRAGRLRLLVGRGF